MVIMMITMVMMTMMVTEIMLLPHTSTTNPPAPLANCF
jgi:hypothetical protein